MTEKRSANGRTRRKFLASTGVAGALALAGCVGGDDDGDDGSSDDGSSDDGGSDDSSSSDDGGSSSNMTEELRFVLNPAEANVDIEAQYQPLFDYMESELDISVSPVRASSYTATVQELRRGGAELADTSPFVPAATDGIADVVGIRVAFGSDKYFSLITTPADGGVEELADIEGETMALAAQTSTSGSLVPLLNLQQAGLDVGAAPQEDPPAFTPRYSDHTTAKEQMLNDPSIVAAGTGAFSTAAHVPQEQFDEMSDDFADLSVEYEDAGSEDPQLNLLAVSDPLPRAPIMARADWEASNRSDIEQVLLDAPTSAFEHGEDYEGEELWFSNIKEGSTEDYDPIVNVLENLEVEVGDI